MDNNKNKELSVLLKKLVNGDKNALGLIYQKVAKGLMYLAKCYFGRNAKADAEDIVHDFMMALVKKADKLKNDKNVCSWMNIVFSNMIKDRLRKQKSLMEVAIDNLIIQAPEVDDNYYFVREAIEKLSKDERNIIFYKYWHGLSLAEIAAIYKIPKSTLEFRLNKILNKLKNII